MNRALIATAAAAAAAGLAAAYAVAGPDGLVVIGTVLAAAALLAARAAITPSASRRPPRRRAAPPAVRPADFPAYRQIESNLGWAAASRRHYDHITRPMLGRLLGAALEERHRLDITRHPERARRLVGADLWPLIDPSAPRSDDSNAPGPDRASLRRVVDRLEQLCEDGRRRDPA
jgi:hypothetical protein